MPTDTILDYYSVIRNTTPNETIIFEYPYKKNYEKTIDIIVDTIVKYLTTGKIYTVIKGDSLYKIAQKYHTTVDELKKLNNLSSSNLTIGMKLKIPVSSSTTNNEEMSPSTKTYTYQVKKGDTLYQIAKNNNTSVAQLKKLNNLSSNTLTIGQTLLIPSPKEEYFIYTVVKGDTLYQIAKKNNTTIDEIKKLNNLTTNTLKIDQKIKIPR